MDNWEDNRINKRESDDYFEIFEKYYRCYSLSRVDKLHLESGNRIIMPESALHRLAYTNVKYPLEFELSNLRSGKITHSGVLEFTAEEGFVYLPTWMMEVMKIQEYDTVKLKNVSLVKAEHMKLQPHSQDFLKLFDPKAFLETSLRNFSCLTAGDTIMIMHDNKKLYIDILETKPSSAVCMIDTDCEVNFAPPLDYKEPEKPVKKVLKPSKVPVKQQQAQPIFEEEEKLKAFISFSGKARRLDGKPGSLQKGKELLAAEGNGKNVCAEAPEPRRAAGKLVFGSQVWERKSCSLSERGYQSRRKSREFREVPII